MSLQYVKPHETKYIPNSVGPDKQLLGQSVNRINQLEDQFFATRTQIDEANHKMLNSMGSLTDEQQNEARDLFEANKQRLDEYVENHGSARASNFARQLASETAREARPYIQRSQEIQEISQVINEAEDLEPNERNLLLADLQRSAESSSLDKRLNFRHDKKVIENWENKYDFAERIQKIMNDPNQSNAHMDEQGNIVPNTVMSDGVQRLLKVSGRQADEYHHLLMTEALNDGQMREQLNMMARLRAENGDDFYSNFIDENGDFDPNKRIIATTNEDGERHFQEGEGNASVNAIEAMATQQFAGISNLMADFSANISANEFTGGEGQDDYVGMHRFAYVDTEQTDYDIEEWRMNLSDEMKEYNNKIQEEIEFLKKHDLNVSLNDDDELVLTGSNDRPQGDEQTLSEFIEQNPEHPLESLIHSTLSVQRYAQSRINYIENVRQQHEDAVLNVLSNDPVLSKYEDAVSFHEETGRFEIDEKAIGEILEDNPEDFQGGFGSAIDVRMIGNRMEAEVERLTNLEDGTVFVGRSPNPITNVNSTLYIKQNGKFYDLSKNNIFKNLNETLNNENERIKEEINSPRQVTAIGLSEELHGGILDDFAKGLINTEGAIQDREGNTLNDASNIIPQSVAYINGQYTIIGKAVDIENNVLEEGTNARLTGREAESVVNRVIENTPGANETMIMTNQLESHLVPSFIRGGTTVTDLSGRPIQNLLGVGAFEGRPVSVSTFRSRQSGRQNVHHVVDIDGDKKRFTNTQQIMQYLIDKEREFLTND